MLSHLGQSCPSIYVAGSELMDYERSPVPLPFVLRLALPLNARAIIIVIQRVGIQYILFILLKYPSIGFTLAYFLTLFGLAYPRRCCAPRLLNPSRIDIVILLLYACIPISRWSGFS